MDEPLRLKRWNEDTVIDVDFKIVSWEKLDTADPRDSKGWKDRALQVTKMIRKMEHSEYKKTIHKGQLAMLVFDSNRMEGTISTRLQQGPTMMRIMELMSIGMIEPPVVEWCSEGGRETNCRSSDRQLFQSAKAVEFLLVQNLNSPLTFDLIVQTHKLLMENSYVEESGNKIPVEVGKVRTVREVYAEGYQFLRAEAVVGALTYLVERYNENSEIHPISLATFLFYELITIHPFENGNGRLCRLLMAWSLMHDGFPFAVNLSSGHKKSRNHYMHAIKHTRRTQDRGELNVILVLSMENVMSNYSENMRLMKNASLTAMSSIGSNTVPGRELKDVSI